MVQQLWKTVCVPQKVKYRINIWPSNSTPRYIPKRIETKHSNRHLYISVHSSVIHSSQKVETTQMTQQLKLMNKQNVLYPYSELLFSNKMEQSTDTYYNTDERWKYHSNWKKLITKDHVVWFHLYELSRISKYIEIKGIQVVA